MHFMQINLYGYITTKGEKILRYIKQIFFILSDTVKNAFFFSPDINVFRQKAEFKG